MTTYTIYSQTQDGYIYKTAVNDYPTARAMGSATAATDPVAVGQYKISTTFACLEGFLQHDCSVIDSGETVSSAIFNGYLDTDVTTQDFTCNARTHDWGATLTAADAVPGANLSALTLLGSFATSGLAAGYNSFSDVAMSALADLKAVDTDFILCSSRMEAGNSPTTTEYFFFKSANASGTSQDPYLDVTAAGAGGGLSIPIAAYHYNHHLGSMAS